MIALSHLRAAGMVWIMIPSLPSRMAMRKHFALNWGCTMKNPTIWHIAGLGKQFIRSNRNFLQWPIAAKYLHNHQPKYLINIRRCWFILLSKTKNYCYRARWVTMLWSIVLPFFLVCLILCLFNSLCLFGTSRRVIPPFRFHSWLFRAFSLNPYSMASHSISIPSFIPSFQNTVPFFLFPFPPPFHSFQFLVIEYSIPFVLPFFNGPFL